MGSTEFIGSGIVIRVKVLDFEIHVLGFRVQGLGFRVEIWGLGFGVKG